MLKVPLNPKQTRKQTLAFLIWWLQLSRMPTIMICTLTIPLRLRHNYETCPSLQIVFLLSSFSSFLCLNIQAPAPVCISTQLIVVTLCASCSAVYCNRSCLFVCGCVGGSVTMITRNCVHRSSANWVCRL